MPAERRLRDTFRSYTPVWLRDRLSTGKTVAYRIMWGIIAMFDVAIDTTYEALTACWPGVGTPTALPLIGRSRGLVRGRTESADAYASRLRGWLDWHRRRGSAEAVARVIQTYCGEPYPRVRAVNRRGQWVTIDPDGTVTKTSASWDWDSVSNPERASFWSELWVIVYTPPWPKAPPLSGRALVVGPNGFGHDAPPAESTMIRALVGDAKAGHTYVRTIIWSYDPTLFDPAVPSSCPDGTWGQWDDGNNTLRGPSGRDVVNCRYWEF